MSALNKTPSTANRPGRPPRLGFLGVGWIGRNRLHAIAATGCADIAAIADTSRELAEEAAASVQATKNALASERNGISDREITKPLLLSSLDELLAQDLDGIVIATPSALHAEQSILALQHGVPVFCQKPLARNGPETQAVIAAARKHNRLLGVDLSYRFLQGAQKIHDLVNGGALGDIYAVELAFHNAYGPNKPWFYDTKLSGGGCVIDLGIHLVDLAMWILKCTEVARVDSALYAAGKKLKSKGVAEDYATALVNLSCGTSLQLSCSWRLPVGCDAIISAAFYGTKAGAVLHNVDGSFYDFVAEFCTGTKRHTLASPPEDWTGRAAVHWTRQLAAGAKFDVEIEKLSAVADTLDRIYGWEK